MHKRLGMEMANRHASWGVGGGSSLGRSCVCASSRIAITHTHTHTHTYEAREFVKRIHGEATLLPLQSTVSESTLIALLAARKNKILEMKASEPEADESFLNARLVAYASDQVSCLQAWLLES